MTDAAWELEAEPGWTWVLMPAIFWTADPNEEQILEAVTQHLPNSNLRAVTVYLDVAENPHCAHVGVGVYDATDEHQATIEQVGAVTLSDTDRRQLDALGARIAERLTQSGLGADRVRVRANPELVIGPRPELSLVRPTAYLHLLLPREEEAPAEWGPAPR